jgi:hypothetical protein
LHMVCQRTFLHCGPLSQTFADRQRAGRSDI